MVTIDKGTADSINELLDDLVNSDEETSEAIVLIIKDLLGIRRAGDLELSLAYDRWGMSHLKIGG